MERRRTWLARARRINWQAHVEMCGVVALGVFCAALALYLLRLI
jgi:hypothetical protein